MQNISHKTPNNPVLFPSDADIRGYDRAQSFAKMIAENIVQRVEVGMSEYDAIEVTDQVFKDFGVRKHWHLPVIGAGPGSTKFTSATRFIKSHWGKKKRMVSAGDILFIDIAPFFEGYPSDFTVTHLYGKNQRLQDMIESSISITRHITTQLRAQMHSGETWQWIQNEIAEKCPYELMQFPICPVAHRFAKIPKYWPLFKEVGTAHLFTMKSPILLRRSKIPMRGLWVVEPLLVDRELNRAAKIEEVIFVSDSETYIFGEKPFAG